MKPHQSSRNVRYGWTATKLFLLASAIAFAVFQFTLIHRAQHLPAHQQSLLATRLSMLQHFVNNTLPIRKRRKPIELPVVADVKPAVVDYYMVFSTSCTPQQNWESYVFFFHAMKVLQPGSVTRIASGCTNEQKLALQTFHDSYIRPMGNFYLYFTPDYSNIVKHVNYKYFNKPFGLLHWMQHGLGLGTSSTNQSLDDAIIMLLDPDMVLRYPMSHDYTDRPDMEWIVDEAHPEPATKMVRHGFPIAQQDGYLRNEWMYLNLTYIVNGTLREQPRDVDGPRIWNTGPPYLATVKDMYALALAWVEFVPRVHELFPQLFAEMFGLIIASLQLNLPFTMTPSLVVSEPAGDDREIWKYIDQLADKDVCSPRISTVPWPIGLHYCQRYMLGKWFFSKYRMKKSILDCEQKLLITPPLDIAVKYDYRAKPPLADGSDLINFTPHHVVMDRVRIKRHGYMLCHMTRAVNEALVYYKRLACGSNANLNTTWDIFTDPSDK
ncbi:hypothetical protein MPSEU_000836100 [Mayamaea pseudoterrestris]|nr:hypothetical protein MPSEU_000836100 [Mayamaea pseudoterrestris]